MGLRSQAIDIDHYQYNKISKIIYKYNIRIEKHKYHFILFPNSASKDRLALEYDASQEEVLWQECRGVVLSPTELREIRCKKSKM